MVLLVSMVMMTMTVTTTVILLLLSVAFVAFRVLLSVASFR